MCSECVSFSHRIRLLQLSHSSPPVTAFDSFSNRIRLLRSLHSTPSAIAFVSFSHCIRLLQPLHLTSSAIAFVSFSHRSRMCQLNEVDELMKWSRWSREMKFMISAQLPIQANGKAKSGLLLLLWFFFHHQQRFWQNRAVFFYLTLKLSGISEKIYKFASKYNIM